MPEVKRKIRVVTKQKINPTKAPIGDFPIRDWSIEVYLLDAQGNAVPATLFDKVTYHLHESFGKKAVQTFKQSPFKLSEQGWGEFELRLTFHPVGKGSPDVTVGHDLNFTNEVYDEDKEVSFKNPKGEFLKILEESGSVGENGVRKGDKKARGGKPHKNVDMEKLADLLQRLTEEDLLQVVQMIHDQKSQESYIKNDADAGEFHVDLYTLPDGLVKNLWEFTNQKTAET